MKTSCFYSLIVLSLLSIHTAFSQTPEPPKLIQELVTPKANPLIQAMERAERAKLDEISIQRSPPPEEISKPAIQDRSSEVSELLDEVERLKSKVVTVKRNTISTQNPRSKKNVGSKTYYTYKEGDIYEVHAGVDVVTDIELQRGERLTNSPIAGDTIRWKMSVASSGQGVEETTHLVLKPLEENIETNIIITTDKRVYHLRALSGDWYMPSVAWSYPDDDARALEETIKRKGLVEAVSLSPENLNFGYRIDGDSYAWTPIRVFDDGKKTYIQMPAEMASSEAPALFVLEEDGEPQLVNYRVKGFYYIVDRLFSRAQMRVGPKLRVDILSNTYRRSFWERVF